jgi:pyruvyltransferase
MANLEIPVNIQKHGAHLELVLKHWIDVSNAGDTFSRDVAEKYIGPVAAVAEGNPVGQPNLLLIGSLLHWADENSIVCGTGLISSNTLPTRTPREIVSVRGPLTRHFLQAQGMHVPDRFGDAGVLAGEFFTSGLRPRYRCGVILHHSEKWLWPKVYFRRYHRRQEILFIDVQAEPMSVFESISQCELIFSSSLHGIIFAHALGCRAAWIEPSDRVVGKGFKFYDYYMSLGITPDQVQPIKLSGVVDLAKYEHLARTERTDSLQSKVKEALAIVRERFSGYRVVGKAPASASQRAIFSAGRL